MSLVTAWQLLRKGVKLGSRSPIVMHAVVFPLVGTLLVQVAFGSPFDPHPRLGIVDKGGSKIAEDALELGGTQIALLGSVTEPRNQVKAIELDVGLELQGDFDRALIAGEKPDLELYIGSESLAPN